VKVPEQNTNSPKVPDASSKEKKPSSSSPKLFAEKIKKKQADLHLSQTSVPLVPQNTLGMPQQQLPQHDGAQVSSASASNLPLPIQNLAHEIQVHVEPSGTAEVRIQFESKVFDGLRVDIRKMDDGGIAINFVTKNDNTSQLLSKHVPALSQALASRGIPVNAIQFERGATFDESEPFNSTKGSELSPRRENANRQRKRR
jgi:flagellar hook-length control protein FliK